MNIVYIYTYKYFIGYYVCLITDSQFFSLLPRTIISFLGQWYVLMILNR